MGELLTEHRGGGDVDGDGSGGQSPSRQGARTGPSDPRNLVSMAAELWNFSWNMALVFRGFSSRGGINRRKGGGWRHPRGPHHPRERVPPGRAQVACGALVAPLCLSFRLQVSSDKKGGSVNFRPIPRIFPE